ncbi:MAG: HEAT repeat domain-containing protein, partial [Lentisphaeria bacterium]|nr:HEAT repeat domain-containing protein [Lentisphaeria bacterium]
MRQTARPCRPGLAVLAVAAALGGGRCLPGQDGVWPAAAAPRPGVGPLPAAEGAPTAPEAAATGHESEAETIAKCLRDLGSEDVALRRRAVMILGKYRTAPAVNAVMAALEDPDADVRRSAVLSLSEWPMVPVQAQSRLLELVRDDNVHVRRLASSLLPELVGGRLPDGLILQGAISLPPIAGGVLPPERVGAVLSAALGDGDVTVRRNVLAMARLLPAVFGTEELAQALGDEDREVRLLALEALGSCRGGEARRAEILAPLAGDPDAALRRETARAAARLGAAGSPLLERLAEDADDGTRLEAVEGLVRLQHPRGLDLLTRTVLDESLPADQRRTLVTYAAFYEGQAEELLRRLTQSSSGILRAEALRGLARLAGPDAEADAFLGYLSDPSVEVRRSAGQAILRLATQRRRTPTGEAVAAVTGEQVLGLFGSPHPDVRQLGVGLSAVLAPEDGLRVLVEACLDEDTGVRCEAIRRLGVLGTPQALELVVQSLEDPDPEEAIAAANTLGQRPDAAAAQALRQFLEGAAEGPVRDAATLAVARGVRRPPPVG